MGWRAAVAVAVVVITFSGGCGDDVTEDERCVAGETRPCVMADGRPGVQMCDAEFLWAASCAEHPDGGVSALDIPWLADGTPPIEPPVLTPCPAGWREVTSEDGPTTCDPYPPAGPMDCAPGEAHFPGEAGCTPAGAPCPAAGDFADGLPVDTRVVYIRPGAAGGDGTEAMPYGAIGEFSLGALPAGTVLALSRGRHLGPFPISRGQVLWGACAADTVLSADVPSMVGGRGVVTLIRDDAVVGVRDLTVADGVRPGMSFYGIGSMARVEGVVVRSTMGVGIVVAFGELDAERVVLRAIRHDRPGADGRGMSVELDATATLRRTVIEDAGDFGIAVADELSSVLLEDLVVRDTAGASDGQLGIGLHTRLGADATVTRALFERNRDAGLTADEPGSTLTLDHVVVRGTEAVAAGTGGRGVDVVFGATATATRLLCEGNRDLALFAGGADTELTASHAILRDTRSRVSDQLHGRGLGAEVGARATVDHVLVDGNLDVGVAASDPMTRLVLADAIVRDTDSLESDGRFGRGLNVQLGAAAVVNRFASEANREHGIVVIEAGAEATITDVVVRDTRARASDLTFGRGLVAQGGGTASLTRALFERNHDVTLTAFTSSTLALSHAVVRDSLPPECFETSCLEAPPGHGAGAYRGARIHMDTFVISTAAACGVHIADDGEMDLVNGEVSDNPIGACVQVDGYDTARLENGVRYLDNESNLQATSLPVPMVAAVAE